MADFRALVAWMALPLLLVPAVHLQAAEPSEDYDTALRGASRFLREGDPVAAESRFRALLDRFPGNPEVLAGLVDSLCRQSRYAEGMTAATTATAGNAELERQRHRCDFAARLAMARAQAPGEADLPALRSLFEDWPDDPYSAGWLYARALEAQGQPAEAEALYARLAERYPADGDFARQRDRLQSARMATTATQPFMGSAFRSAHRNQVTASAGGARYDRNSPDDRVESLSFTHSGMGYALTLGADHQRRFDQSSSAFSATLDTRLAPRYDGAFSASWSPEGRFLPKYSVGADVGRYVSAGRAYVAVRHLSFENSSATIVTPGFLWDLGDRMRIDTRVYWVPAKDSWSLQVTPQWVSQRGHRTAVTLSTGMASEDLGIAGGTLRASTYSVRLAQRWRITAHWAVGGDVFHEHRTGLYNRSGANLQGGVFVVAAGWERVLELVILGMLISLVLLIMFMIVQKLRIEHVRRREERVALELSQVLSNRATDQVPSLDPSVAPDRRALARALALHGDAASVSALLSAYPRLIERLQRETRHGRWGRRAAAIEGLGLLRLESLRDFFLQRVATDPDARVRAAVLDALARLVRRPEDLTQLAFVIPQVPGLAAGFLEGVLVRALQSLENAGASSAAVFETFLAGLSATDPILRVALAAAGRTGQARLLPLVVARTIDPAVPLPSRLSGMRTLGRLQPDHPVLLEGLKSAIPEMRLVAARAIRDSSPEVLAALRTALTDANFHVRRNAARTLFLLGEAGSAALRDTREGPDAYAADMSRFVLARETPR